MPSKVDIEAIRAALRSRNKGRKKSTTTDSEGDEPSMLNSDPESAIQDQGLGTEAPVYINSVAYVTIHKESGFPVRYDFRTGKSRVVKDLNTDQD